MGDRELTGSVWTYVGPGDEAGDVHLVTGSDKKGCTTWSEPLGLKEEIEDVGGYSWSGSLEEFARNFEPIKEAQ